MSWVKVYVHMVFSTKNRKPLLNSPEIRHSVYNHMKTNAQEKGIWLDCVNGYQDHAHCLISLGKEQTISQVAKLIKGESSFWINKTQLIETQFNWQNDYWVAGVRESHINAVRNYIHNQESHHANHTFADEIDKFMKKYGWTHSLD